jgi:hypothetical protein
MTRWLTALIGCFFLAGCPQNLPPEPPLPPDAPGPIVVTQEPRDESADGAEAQTRQQALRVMATEQVQQTRFVRTASHRTQRVRNALGTCEDELTSIESGIATVASDDSLSAAERHERQDELKVRIHRLASKLALMQTALREQ